MKNQKADGNLQKKILTYIKEYGGEYKDVYIKDILIKLFGKEEYSHRRRMKDFLKLLKKDDLIVVVDMAQLSLWPQGSRAPQLETIKTTARITTKGVTYVNSFKKSERELIGLVATICSLLVAISFGVLSAVQSRQSAFLQDDLLLKKHHVSQLQDELLLMKKRLYRAEILNRMPAHDNTDERPKHIAKPR